MLVAILVVLALAGIAVYLWIATPPGAPLPASVDDVNTQRGFSEKNVCRLDFKCFTAASGFRADCTRPSILLRSVSRGILSSYDPSESVDPNTTVLIFDYVCRAKRR